MGESAVLFHSYSFAAPHNQSHEDNTIHALSQSVSFGRFMTENLEWGKWSTFSHKKYVDEAEKFSQPGSVAQKKAFFEAHYKKIADAKKAKTSDESSNPIQQPQQQQEPECVAVLLNTLETLTKDESSNPIQPQQQQEPECVAVLLNTLETLTKDEVKEEAELVLSSEEQVLSVEKDDEPERKSGVVLEEEKEDSTVVDKPAVADDFEKSDVVLEHEDDDAIVHDEMEVKENHTEDEELFKKSPSFGEKVAEARRSVVTKSSSMSISSMETSATSEAPDKAKEHAFSQKISERPVTQSSVKQNKNPVRQRFSFLKCLMGNTKTQDQNTTTKKRKTDKKQNKPFRCLCFKPEMVGETEAPIRKQRKNL